MYISVFFGGGDTETVFIGLRPTKPTGLEDLCEFDNFLFHVLFSLFP